LISCSAGTERQRCGEVDGAHIHGVVHDYKAVVFEEARITPCPVLYLDLIALSIAAGSNNRVRPLMHATVRQFTHGGLGRLRLMVEHIKDWHQRPDLFTLQLASEGVDGDVMAAACGDGGCRPPVRLPIQNILHHHSPTIANVPRAPSVRCVRGMLNWSVYGGLVCRLEKEEELCELSADGGAAGVCEAEKRCVLQHLLPLHVIKGR
jgi:hypothetical protein